MSVRRSPVWDNGQFAIIGDRTGERNIYISRNRSNSEGPLDGNDFMSFETESVAFSFKEPSRRVT